jgi:hypothetical protein
VIGLDFAGQSTLNQGNQRWIISKGRRRIIVRLEQANDALPTFI